MRADRLISILLLLKKRGKVTTKELAQELEVTQRTIHRDMEALISAGIPIFSERGKGGGWSIMDNWQNRLSWLKNEEVQSLFIPSSNNLLADLGFNEISEKAREKLYSSVPYQHKEEAIKLWERVYIDTSTWKDRTEHQAFITDIKRALFNEKKLKIIYEKYNGKSDERIIEPLGLVSKGDKWYLVALKKGEYRNYRVSRIKSVIMLDEEFTYPSYFNLQSYWKKSKKEFVNNLPRYIVQVKVLSSIIPRLKFTGKFVEVIEVGNNDIDQWLPVTLSFHSEEEAVEYIFGFGNKMKVANPVHLKDTLIIMAKDVIDMYKE
ncbi:helix-turn-helix transcriptional regulator [Pseudalkalibacillus caeni]|uniref:YafY family transcriptional regulator n=1 Tax=Exobacillus caeni TaxID=2574798 RepID=A0A5R9EZZ9_9BACL|nr:YafY family protein [Pseudalkalibacillus caeni]TLS36827.1 YafY family transcriptional regulator [Pseudalkalibacillus caeni]